MLVYLCACVRVYSTCAAVHAHTCVTCLSLRARFLLSLRSAPPRDEWSLFFWWRVCASQTSSSSHIHPRLHCVLPVHRTHRICKKNVYMERGDLYTYMYAPSASGERPTRRLLSSSIIILHFVVGVSGHVEIQSHRNLRASRLHAEGMCE